jgi:hypothetical protein
VRSTPITAIGSAVSTYRLTTSRPDDRPPLASTVSWTLANAPSEEFAVSE